MHRRPIVFFLALALLLVSAQFASAYDVTASLSLIEDHVAVNELSLGGYDGPAHVEWPRIRHHPGRENEIGTQAEGIAGGTGEVPPEQDQIEDIAAHAAVYVAANGSGTVHQIEARSRQRHQMGAQNIYVSCCELVVEVDIATDRDCQCGSGRL